MGKKYISISIFLTILFLLTATNLIANDDFSQKEKESYLKAYEKAYKSVIGLEFKALDPKETHDIFEAYKKIKLKIIKKSILGEDYSKEKVTLFEVREKFNQLIYDEFTFKLVEMDHDDNRYIEKFKYLFLTNFINFYGDKDKINACILKVIYSK